MPLEPSTLAAIATGAVSAAVGITAGVRLVPSLARTRRIARAVEAESQGLFTGDEIVKGLKRAGKPSGNLRSSNIAGMAGGALRRKDGGYTRGYRLSPKASMLAHPHTLDNRYETIAKMLGARKPAGTLITFRYASDGDPGAPIQEHLATRPPIDDVHPGARLLQETGLEYMLGKAASGAFRRERESVWVSVPSSGGDNSGDGTSAFLTTLLNELKRDGVRNFLAAVAKAKAESAGERITRRMLREEGEAFREAEQIFKQVERDCPKELRIERLTPQETFDALYLSHNQNADSAPPLSRGVLFNMQQYLCRESIEYGRSYMLHGRYPAALVALDVVPQRGPAHQKKIIPTVTRHLIGNPTLNFRHQIVTQFVCLDKQKAKDMIEGRMTKLEQVSTDVNGVVHMKAEARAAYVQLSSVDDQLTDPSENVVYARMFVIVYSDPATNQQELRASLRRLDDRCAEVVTAIRNMDGADASRVEGADLRFLYETAITGEERAYPLNGLEHTEVGDTLSCLTPTETAFTGYRNWHSLYSTVTGRLFGYNVFNTSITSSPVVLVLGGQGSGKSTLMADIVCDVLAAIPKATAYMTDFGGSFAWLCRFVGGRQYRFEESDPSAINPFDYPDLEHGIMPSKIQISLVVGFITKLAGVPLDDKTTQRIIKKAVLEVYRNAVPRNQPDWPRYEPTLSNFLEVLRVYPWDKGLQKEKAEAINLALEEYQGDPWLDAPTDERYRVESPLHVFELDSLHNFEDDLKAALSYIVAAFITRSTGRRNPDGTTSPSVHVYDEVWKIEAELPEMIFPISRDTRQGRKEKVIPMLGTHAYEDLERLYGVISNAGTRIIGLQNRGFDKLAADADLSPAACEAVRHITNVEGEHAEYVISIGAGTKQTVEMIRVVYSPVKMWTYTSHSAERNARVLVDHALGDLSDLEKIGWLAANWPRGLAYEGKDENDPEFLRLLNQARSHYQAQRGALQPANN